MPGTSAQPGGDNPSPLIEPLTQRELDILRLLVKRLSNDEIARAITLSVGTVKWYVKQIYSKLGVHSRAEAIARAAQLDLLGEALPQADGAEQPNGPLFVARERELDRLTSLLDRALAGHSEVVFIIGEAGQGKTALLGEFARWAQSAHSSLLESVS